MSTGIDYLRLAQEAERRQREREAEKQRREQAARQALDKGIAPADMTEDIVKAAMSPAPQQPPPKTPAPELKTEQIQPVYEAQAMGAWSPWTQKPLNLPTELKTYSKGSQVDIVGFLRDAQNDAQAIRILSQANISQADIEWARQRVEDENTLRKYRNTRGEYDLTWAIRDSQRFGSFKEELKIVDAIYRLFPEHISKEFERQRQMLMRETERGVDNPWTDAWHEVTASSPWIAGALSTTQGTPFPHDDIVTRIIIYSIVGGTAVGTIIKNFTDKRNAKPNNLALVEMSGDILKSVAFIKPENVDASDIEVILPPRNLPRPIEGFPQHTIEGRGKEKIQPPKVKIDFEKVTGQLQPALVLIDPPTTRKDIGITGLVQSQVAVKEAESQVAEVAQKTEIPQVFIDAFERNAAHLRKGTNYRDWFMQPNITPQMRQQFKDAYANNVGFRVVFNDYLNRLQELSDRKRVYVETVNPKPIKGKLSKEDIEAIAGAKLLHEIGIETKGKTIEEVKTALLYADSPLISGAVKIYNQTYTQAISKGLTKTKAATKAAQAVKTYVKEQAVTQTKPAVKTKTATRTLTGTAAKTLEAVMPLARAATATTAATATARTTTTTKIPELGGDSPDKRKRQAIKESLGAVTYRRGELNGKDVWHVFYVDKGGNPQRAIIVGPAPEGATVSTGRGSASATLKRIRGKRVPNFRFVEDTGASDTIVSASGGKITITFTGDITGKGIKISKQSGRITPRWKQL